MTDKSAENLDSLPASVPSERRAAMTFFALGVLCLFPWNCFLSAIEFFEQSFGSDWPLYSTQVYQTVFMVVQLGMVMLRPRSNLCAQFLLPSAGCIGSAVAVMAAALGPGSQHTRFIVCLVFTACLGASMAVMQSSVFGLAAQGIERFGNLPGQLFTGMGAAGIAAMLLSLVSAAVAGITISFVVLFVAIVVLAILSLSQYRVLKQLTGPSIAAPAAVNELGIGLSESEAGQAGQVGQEAAEWSICRSIRAGLVYELAIFCVFAVSFMLFPAIAGQWKAVGLIPSNIYLTLVMGMFQLMDTLSRWVAEHVRFLQALGQPVRLWSLVIARMVVFVPLFFLCKDGQGVFGSQWFQLTVMAAFAFSNGLLGSLAMQFAPQRAPAPARGTIGMAMTLALVGGIAAGSYLAMLPIGH